MTLFLTICPLVMRARRGLCRVGAMTICAVSVMHIVQAAMMYAYPKAAGATGTLFLLMVLRALGMPDGPVAMASLMTLTAVIALVAALLPVGRIRLSLFLPQHFFLGIMALGGWVAALHGAYLDGTVIPWSHIVVDQVGMTALWISHSSAIVRRSREDA